jgi:NCS1 family nucleobase:cation symporter-1
MTDPQTALGAILPGWFRPTFLLAVVPGTVANNAMTAYSSGLALQAVGVRIRSSRSVAIDGTLSVAMTQYALLVSNCWTPWPSMLQVMVALLGPSMAIYAADILLRRNRCDGRDLSDQTRTSPFWCTAGVNWADVTVLIAGTVVASQCLTTSFYTGPIVRAAGGTDLSLPVGLLLSAVTYLLMMTQSRRPAVATLSRPGPSARGRVRS